MVKEIFHIPKCTYLLILFFRLTDMVSPVLFFNSQGQSLRLNSSLPLHPISQPKNCMSFY